VCVVYIYIYAGFRVCKRLCPFFVMCFGLGVSVCVCECVCVFVNVA